MSPVLGWPLRAPRSHQAKPGAQAHGVGKGTTASGEPTGAPRATGPGEARRTTRGHEAHQRGTLPATTKAHGQVPSNNVRRGPQTWRARTTHSEPRYESRCQPTPAAVRTDVCAPGSEPSPCRLRNSRRPDGRVRARRVPSPCRLRTAAVRMDECAPGGHQAPTHTNSCRPDGRVCAPQRRPEHATHTTTHRASTLVNRSQVAQDTAHATQHTEPAHR